MQSHQKVAVVALVLMTGCYHRQQRFSEVECNRYRGTGTATISGRLVVRAAGGGDYGGSNQVYLYPATAYLTEWLEREILRHEPVVPAVDARVKSCRREAVTDNDGQFDFEGIPAGQYYLVFDIGWFVSTPSGPGLLVSAVKVEEGQTKKVIVKKEFPVATQSFR